MDKPSINSPATSAEITASSGSNLALAFFCLPKVKRRAMSIFYAFCRVIDDIADSTELPLKQKRRQLEEWRQDINRAYTPNKTPRSPLGKELGEIIRDYHLTHEFLEEILVGVETDLTKTRQANFAELEKYCYGVASAVGLVSMEIFGYSDIKRGREYAIALGMAFQLTNILRDVKKDASFGRIYLPLDELAAWGLTEADVLESRWSPKMEQFLRFQHHRARHYFAKSWRLLSPQDRPQLIAAEIMRGVYSAILDKIEHNGFNVFNEETRLNKPQKIWQIVRALIRERRARPTPPAPKKVVILGAGFAGLSAAVELSLRGHNVTVLESRNMLGGRAHSFVEPKTGSETDNGQHILMGCYHESLRLIDTLGVSSHLLKPEALDVPYCSDRGSSELKAPALPAPLHLLVGLLNFNELSWSDRWAAAKLSLRLRLGQAPLPDETVEAWLKRWGQTLNLTRAVWEPLCISALNEPVATASAMLFATVIKRALLGSSEDSKIIISKVGLSRLFAPEAEQLLNLCGSKIVRNKVVKSFQFDGNRIAKVETQDGSVFEADHVISALPWNALRTLIPAESPLAEACHQMGEAPIVSVHLWLDKSILDRPFIGFLDSPLHWVFSGDHIREKTEATATAEATSEPSHRYALIVSGARELIGQSSEEIEAMAVRELHKFLPESRDAQVIHRLIYKSRSATFATTPESEKLRPNAATTSPNFWLAGDWTNTGLPATLEGAIVSGQTSAQLVDATQ